MKTDLLPRKAGEAISELKHYSNYATVLIIYFKQHSHSQRITACHSPPARQLKEHYHPSSDLQNIQTFMIVLLIKTQNSFVLILYLF